MRRIRIPHQVFQTVFGVVAMGLVTNLLLAVACLPLIVLAITTDPAMSWPALALAAAAAFPGFAAAVRVFREHGHGELGTVRAFLTGYRETGWRALLLGAVTMVVLVILAVDTRVVAESTVGVVVVPILAVVALLTASVAVVGLVALAEEPRARLRDIVTAAAHLTLRRWYLTAVTLAVLAVQIVLFVWTPALALGFTAAPALYLAWANSRYTLRPVLDVEDVVE